MTQPVRPLHVQKTILTIMCRGAMGGSQVLRYQRRNRATNHAAVALEIYTTRSSRVFTKPKNLLSTIRSINCQACSRMTGTNGNGNGSARVGTSTVKQGLAQMLKGGVIVSGMIGIWP